MTPAQRRELRSLLSSPPAVRQAFVIREVLGPPVALRDDSAVDRPQ